ncbi:MAG: sigma-70 family RNA polymerase sigma factor [Sphingomonadales bacterium]|jgi:RNA polymerase sigma factor (sigma-70 family)|nr:sigma-70 family RNA polymerase sigma factor [Sphingomonadales bacterium]MBK6718676.1 sigma-70 family RNA polymerase sigma factor [Sphingomonadales bacterium]MBL0002223.1 sigma-70 family RNA polymerase sigma factor [Sphingomonadales bacterium]
MSSATTQAAEDDMLMARVAARDADAFRALIEAHAGKAHRIGWRMLGDAVEAEDVAQEAMLKLWEQAGKWQAGGAGVGAWLNRVATNLCLDRLRRRRFSSDQDVPERVDETPLADAQMDADWMRDRAMLAVQALPDRQRAAIVLTYYEDCSNLAAAEILGLNIKAFESLLLRARQALKAGLGDVRAAFAGGAA